MKVKDCKMQMNEQNPLSYKLELYNIGNAEGRANWALDSFLDDHHRRSHNGYRNGKRLFGQVLVCLMYGCDGHKIDFTPFSRTLSVLTTKFFCKAFREAVRGVNCIGICCNFVFLLQHIHIRH